MNNWTCKSLILSLAIVFFWACNSSSKKQESVVEESPSSPIFWIDSTETLLGNFGVLRLHNIFWLKNNLSIETKESWCYDGKNEECESKGRLYRWESASLACQQLGEGWRLPTDEEWVELAETVGGYYDYNEARENGNARNSNRSLISDKAGDFNAVLNGWRGSNGGYADKGKTGFYWSSSELNEEQGIFYIFSKEGGRLTRRSVSKRMGMSCRCVREI